MSLLSIRCFTCNKVIANKWDAYRQNMQEGLSSDESLTKIGLKRYCCRRMLQTHSTKQEEMILLSEKVLPAKPQVMRTLNCRTMKRVPSFIEESLPVVQGHPV